MKSIVDELTSPEEANAEISRLLKECDASLAAAKRLADKHGLTFTFQVEGNHGLWDTYVGMAYSKKHDKYLWDTQYENMEDLEADYNGWQSSSAHC